MINNIQLDSIPARRRHNPKSLFSNISPTAASLLRNENEIIR